MVKLIAFPACLEPERPLMFSQESATGPCREPYELFLVRLTMILPSLISHLSTIILPSVASSLSHLVFRLKFYIHYSSFHLFLFFLLHQ
jgi:hypothetical protein